MLVYNDNQALYSIHLFKTAGNSFHIILKDWFGRGCLHHKYNPRYKSVARLKTEKRNFMGKKIPVCIHGHFPVHSNFGLRDIYPEFQQCITFLREPLDLQISAFCFSRKLFEQGKLFHNGAKVEQFPYKDLDTFLETQPSCMLIDLPWSLTEENYQEIIHSNFVHIGLTDYFKKSIEILADKLNKEPPSQYPVKNATIRRYQASKQSMEIFIEKHKLEYEIYDYIKSINDI